MTIASVRFRRVPAPQSRGWRPPWSSAEPGGVTFHAYGKELISELVRACRRAGWSAEDHGEWEVSDVRWDPDFRVNLVIAGVRARIYVLPPSRLHQEGEILIEDIESDVLRAEVEAVVRVALSSRPGLALVQASVQPGG